MGAKKEYGFTIFELIVSSAMVSVLSALSIPAYKEFLEVAYKAHQIQSAQDMIQALEIGITEMESESPNGVYEDYVSGEGLTVMYSGDLTPGPVPGNAGGWHPYAEAMLPGYVSGRNMISGVAWNPNCANGNANCWQFQMYSLHCKTNKLYYYYMYGDGAKVNLYLQSSENCLGVPLS